MLQERKRTRARACETDSRVAIAERVGASIFAANVTRFAALCKPSWLLSYRYTKQPSASDRANVQTFRTFTDISVAGCARLKAHGSSVLRGAAVLPFRAAHCTCTALRSRLLSHQSQSRKGGLKLDYVQPTAVGGHRWLSQPQCLLVLITISAPRAWLNKEEHSQTCLNA